MKIICFGYCEWGPNLHESGPQHWLKWCVLLILLLGMSCPLLLYFTSYSKNNYGWKSICLVQKLMWGFKWTAKASCLDRKLHDRRQDKTQVSLLIYVAVSESKHDWSTRPLRCPVIATQEWLHNLSEDIFTKEFLSLVTASNKQCNLMIFCNLIIA